MGDPGASFHQPLDLEHLLRSLKQWLPALEGRGYSRFVSSTRKEGRGTGRREPAAGAPVHRPSDGWRGRAEEAAAPKAHTEQPLGSLQSLWPLSTQDTQEPRTEDFRDEATEFPGGALKEDLRQDARGGLGDEEEFETARKRKSPPASTKQKKAKSPRKARKTKRAMVAGGEGATSNSLAKEGVSAAYPAGRLEAYDSDEKHSHLALLQKTDSGKLLWKATGGRLSAMLSSSFTRHPSLERLARALKRIFPSKESGQWGWSPQARMKLPVPSKTRWGRLPAVQSQESSDAAIAAATSAAAQEALPLGNSWHHSAMPYPYPNREFQTTSHSRHQLSLGETVPERQLYSAGQWREQHNASLESVLRNRDRPFFVCGPRWRSHDWLREQAAARSAMEDRRNDALRTKRMEARELAAREFHTPRDTKAGCLPDVTPSLPLALARGDRIVTIVTTACLPWLTGTSINPLLRAAYLEKCFQLRVGILFPFIPPAQQKVIHPGNVFETPEEQATYVRSWVERRLGIVTKMKISFYDAWYDPRKGSIFPLDGSDVTECIPDAEADVAILEEPEHLCWYHFVGPRWREKFERVVGIAHTNYMEYIRRDELYGGPTVARFLWLYNVAVVRANCHLVIRLSAGVQWFASSVVCNVHGVSPQFLEPSSQGEALHFSKGFYFIGKTLWGKGYRELCDLLLYHCQHNPQVVLPAAMKPSQNHVPMTNGTNGHGQSSSAQPAELALGGHARLEVDIYGNGFDFEEISSFAAKNSLPMSFKGRKDHADPDLLAYKVFVNPSLSDVLCTTTAEAVAMGKLIVVADHPSNEFFRDNFPQNCITYNPAYPEEFSRAIRKALAAQPQPLTDAQRTLLTWEAATDRLMHVAGLA